MKMKLRPGGMIHSIVENRLEGEKSNKDIFLSCFDHDIPNIQQNKGFVTTSGYRLKVGDTLLYLDIESGKVWRFGVYKVNTPSFNDPSDLYFPYLVRIPNVYKYKTFLGIKYRVKTFE